jgi:PilZ domain
MITPRDAGKDGMVERRSMRRFEMRLPATIRISNADGEEWLTETQNVSARGLFFYATQSLSPGTRLEVTLTFPPQITFTDSIHVRFTARVVRVEPGGLPGRTGVAAVIEEYEFLRSLRNRGGEGDLGEDGPKSN